MSVFRLTLFTLAFASLTLSACGDDDDDDTGTNTGTGTDTGSATDDDDATSTDDDDDGDDDDDDSSDDDDATSTDDDDDATSTGDDDDATSTDDDDDATSTDDDDDATSTDDDDDATSTDDDDDATSTDDDDDATSTDDDDDDLPTTATVNIPATGGTIELLGATITFPAGAVTTATDFTATIADSSSVAAPPGATFLTGYLTITPHGTTLALPATIALATTAAPTATAVALRRDNDLDTSWAKAANDAAFANDTITFTTTAFSIFGGANVDTTANPCETNNGGFDDLALCDGTDGIPTCTCKPDEAIGDGITCVANPCFTDNGGCDALATCDSDGTTTTCICPTGYVGDGLTCYLDLCLTDNGGCDENASCDLTDGDVFCTCNGPEYFGDGTTCAFDFCTFEPPNCDENATCSNEADGGKCTCKPDYTGDGFTCTTDLLEAVEFTIFPDKPTLVTTKDGFQLSIPPGAVTKATDITLKVYDRTYFADPPSPVEQTSPYYEFTPTIDLAQPAELTFPTTNTGSSYVIYWNAPNESVATLTKGSQKIGTVNDLSRGFIGLSRFGLKACDYTQCYTPPASSCFLDTQQTWAVPGNCNAISGTCSFTQKFVDCTKQFPGAIGGCNASTGACFLKACTSSGGNYASPTENCDTQDANGCEAPLYEDPNNCGACGVKCSAPNSACSLGRCTTPTFCGENLDNCVAPCYDEKANPATGGDTEKLRECIDTCKTAQAMTGQDAANYANLDTCATNLCAAFAFDINQLYLCYESAYTGTALGSSFFICDGAARACRDTAPPVECVAESFTTTDNDSECKAACVVGTCDVTAGTCTLSQDPAFQTPTCIGNQCENAGACLKACATEKRYISENETFLIRDDCTARCNGIATNETEIGNYLNLVDCMFGSAGDNAFQTCIIEDYLSGVGTTTDCWNEAYNATACSDSRTTCPVP